MSIRRIRRGRPAGLPARNSIRSAKQPKRRAPPARSCFIGEFGDVAGATPFLTNLLDEFISERIGFAAIWVWEFYQTSTYETRNTEPTRYDVEPGYSDDVIAMLMQAERRLGHMPPAKDPAAPPRVVLTWPLPCAAVARPIEIEAVASDG